MGLGSPRTKVRRLAAKRTLKGRLVRAEAGRRQTPQNTKITVSFTPGWIGAQDANR
jgi:hypothetical protein